jgi:hypothetical protein
LKAPRSPGHYEKCRVPRAILCNKAIAGGEEDFRCDIDDRTKLLPGEAVEYWQSLKKPDLGVEHGDLDPVVEDALL